MNCIESNLLVQAGTHAISQGVLSLMQGSDFISGAAGAFFGSLGASGFGAIAGDWAGKVEGQIFFGALSGGVGAELSGGNFWQGAVTGGIVAGLNHAMHKVEDIIRVKKALKKLNIDPKGKPKETKAEVVNLIVKDDNLKQMYENAKYPSVLLDLKMEEVGRADIGFITIGKKAFQTYRTLYLVIGHELIHAYHYSKGLISYWTNIHGKEGAEYITEMAAYSWTKMYDEPYYWWEHQKKNTLLLQKI